MGMKGLPGGGTPQPIRNAGTQPKARANNAPVKNSGTDAKAVDNTKPIKNSNQK